MCVCVCVCVACVVQCVFSGVCLLEWVCMYSFTITCMCVCVVCVCVLCVPPYKQQRYTSKCASLLDASPIVAPVWQPASRSSSTYVTSFSLSATQTHI